MENTLKPTDESLASLCKREVEADGTLLFRYSQAPLHWQKHLYKMFLMASIIGGFIMGLAGFVFVWGSFNNEEDGSLFFIGIPLLGLTALLYWFSAKWLPRKLIFDSGKLRIVPNVGFRISEGNLPFKDVQSYTQKYNGETESYDILAVTNMGSHTIARCVTSEGSIALMNLLRDEGVVNDWQPDSLAKVAL